MNEDYNGWTGKGNRASAYATWRVMLELVSDVQDEIISEWFDEKPRGWDLANRIEDWVGEIVAGEDYNQQTLATQYAMAFLDDVNWDEIAEHILADWPEDEDDSSSQ